LDWSDYADPAWLVRAVGDWRERQGPLYKRLADAIREVVAAGDLPPGARLAPERDLAAALGVSRSTVMSCYERLASEGRLDRRQGSGTRVRSAGGPAGRSAAERDARPLVDRGSRIHPRAGERIIDLTVAGPEISDPVRRAVRTGLDAFGDDDLGHGYRSQGLHALRVTVAAHLSSRGVATTPEEVMITTGAHQGLALLMAAHVRPGEIVATEDPTYAGIIDVIENAGGRPTPMAVDREGLQPEALEAAVLRRGARLVHVVPTGQNPTGTVMPHTRRLEIARLASELGATLVEDTVFEDVSLRRLRPDALAALAPDAPIVTVGSLSKLFWGGLRTGWVRAPAAVIDRLVRLKMMLDHGSSTVSQAAAMRLLDEVDAQRERMREHLERGIALVKGALEGPLSGWEWRPPEAGLSAWMRLPVPEATRFTRFARRLGVAVVPGSATSPRGAFEDHVRISLGPSPETLAAGLDRLGEAWAAFSPEARPEPVGTDALV
jgi:DNA-binding transcriptional MocR family regulator